MYMSLNRHASALQGPLIQDSQCQTPVPYFLAALPQGLCLRMTFLG